MHRNRFLSGTDPTSGQGVQDQHIQPVDGRDNVSGQHWRQRRHPIIPEQERICQYGHQLGKTFEPKTLYRDSGAADTVRVRNVVDEGWGSTGTSGWDMSCIADGPLLSVPRHRRAY